MLALLPLVLACAGGDPAVVRRPHRGDGGATSGDGGSGTDGGGWTDGGSGTDGGSPTEGDDTGTDGGSPAPLPLVVVTWNLESGDATLASHTERVAAVTGEALWAFEEVQNEDWARAVAEAAADADQAPFEVLVGTTGGADHLALAWEPDRLDLLDWEELDQVNVGGNVRAPLVGHFRLAEGGELLVMVNHLWRSDEDARHRQASLLHDWALEQTLPVIALGDYNFDWQVEGGEVHHDAGYDLLTADGAWTWIQHDPLWETHCSDYDSVLDFVFLGASAAGWTGRAEVIAPEGPQCEDTPTRSDHRPVWAELEPAPTPRRGSPASRRRWRR
jgi:endonuclease/exonuclease/phosphatase family metal-dependent hydrolase